LRDVEQYVKTLSNSGGCFRAGSLLEQLEDGQHDVVDVAEPRGLGLLGVVESAGPVDGDVRLLLVQLQRPSWREKSKDELPGL